MQKRVRGASNPSRRHCSSWTGSQLFPTRTLGTTSRSHEPAEGGLGLGQSNPEIELIWRLGEFGVRAWMCTVDNFGESSPDGGGDGGLAINLWFFGIGCIYQYALLLTDYTSYDLIRVHPIFRNYFYRAWCSKVFMISYTHRLGLAPCYLVA